MSVKLEVDLSELQTKYPDMPINSSDYKIIIEDVELTPQNFVIRPDWWYYKLNPKSKERISELIGNKIVIMTHYDEGLSYPLVEEKDVLIYDFDRGSTNNIGSTPPNNPFLGIKWYNTLENIWYTWNGFTWLSDEKLHLVFNKSGNADGTFLRIGECSTINTGYIILRDARIVYITASGTEGLSNKTFELRKKGVSLSLFTFSLNSYLYSNSNVDLDLDANDILQCFCTNIGSTIKNPIISITLSWRI